MKNKSLVRMLALGIPLLLIAACGGSDNGAAQTATAMPQAQVVTLDARGQEIYATNCQVCHGMPNSGAPQSGELADWQERSGKGMDTMLDNVMDGFQAMPAMGGCFDCNEDDFRQLITFMTSGMLK